jgi:DNA-binding response OmpR family regulator
MESVLIIDDEQAILQVFDYALTRNGYDVETAADGREGIQKFLTGRFDLVVTDVLLQGMDGRDILKRIRSSEKRQTPVIGMSGTPWLLDGAGFDHVLAKPFSIHHLVESIQGLIKRDLPKA